MPSRQEKHTHPLTEVGVCVGYTLLETVGAIFSERKGFFFFFCGGREGGRVYTAIYLTLSKKKFLACKT